MKFGSRSSVFLADLDCFVIATDSKENHPTVSSLLLRITSGCGRRRFRPSGRGLTYSPRASVGTKNPNILATFLNLTVLRVVEMSISENPLL